MKRGIFTVLNGWSAFQEIEFGAALSFDVGRAWLLSALIYSFGTDACVGLAS